MCICAYLCVWGEGERKGEGDARGGGGGLVKDSEAEKRADDYWRSW